jgi:hypothetical protein
MERGAKLFTTGQKGVPRLLEVELVNIILCVDRILGRKIHTTVDVSTARVEVDVEAALQFLLDTLLGHGHEIRRPEDLADLGKQRIVTGHAHQVRHLHLTAT